MIRYVSIDDSRPIAETMQAAAAACDTPPWWAPYWTPENICAACGHPRNCHLGEAPLKGMPKEDDSGWCTLPAGTCIHNPCACKAFVEPEGGAK